MPEIARIIELQELDLEGEWDPNKHDAQMAALYDVDNDIPEEDVRQFAFLFLYPQLTGVSLQVDGKPVWNDDIDVSDLVPSEKKSKKQKKKEERRKLKTAATAGDDDGVDIDAMDADATRETFSGMDVDDEEWDGTEEMRRRKLDEYMDELYGMEFTDIVSIIIDSVLVPFPFCFNLFLFCDCPGRSPTCRLDSNTHQLTSQTFTYQLRTSSRPPMRSSTNTWASRNSLLIVKGRVGWSGILNAANA